MDDFGYDVEDHRQVAPMFGCNEDFDVLLARAHELEIRVIMDLVLSHCAASHPWFQSCLEGQGSPYDDAFIWVDPAPGGGPPNNWLSVFGGSAWTFHEGRQQYYLHNFLTSQPDLNYHSSMVREEALSIARYWLDKGVDGFRLDAINFCLHDPELRDNPPATDPDGQSVQLSNPYGTLLHVYDKNHPEMPGFLEELRGVLDEYEGRVTLGEIGASRQVSQSLMGEYTKPGRLNLCYSFDLLAANFDAEHFRGIVNRLGVTNKDFWGCWAFSNHDVVRGATRLTRPGDNHEEVAEASLALLLSFRGTPCIYQGEELGLEEVEIPYEQLVDPYGIAFYPEFKGRDGCRTPMPWAHDSENAGFCPDNVTPWLPIPPQHRDKAVDASREKKDGPYQVTKSILAYRKRHQSLSIGEMVMEQKGGQVLSFQRIHGDEVTCCGFNLSSEPIEIPLPEGWESGDKLERGVSPSTESAALLLSPWAWYLHTHKK